jgi:hypothetical protein
MRLFESWWDYVRGPARCSLTLLFIVGLPLMTKLGHFWD